MFQVYFGHNLGFRGFYQSFFFLGFGVILVSGVFWSSYMFRGILVIIQVSGVFNDHFFKRFLGYFGHFLGFGIFRSFFRFQGILVIFLGFRGISVFFQVLLVFWSFYWFQEGILVLFLVQGGYFSHFFFQVFGGISIIFQVLGYFCNFFRFRGYFSYFLGFRGISVTFQVSRVFW